MEDKKILKTFCVGLVSWCVITTCFGQEKTGYQERVSKKLGIPEEQLAVCIEKTKPGSHWEEENERYNKENNIDSDSSDTHNSYKKLTLLQCLQEYNPELTQKQLSRAMNNK